MKKQLSVFFIVLSMIFTMFPAAAFAAESYPIFVGSTLVTSENCQNITGPGISGKVSYDPETNVLTLEDATITSFYQSAENNIAGLSLEQAGLTVHFIGKNEIAPTFSDITPISCNAIYSAHDLTLTADQGACVTIKAVGGQENTGILLSGNLKLSGGSFEIESGSSTKGASYGIWVEKKLESTAELTVTSGSAIRTVALLCGGDLVLDAPAVIRSGAASEKESCGAICKSFSSAAGKLTIQAGEAPKSYSAGLSPTATVTLNADQTKKYVFTGHDFAIAANKLELLDTDWWCGNVKSVTPDQNVYEQKSDPIEKASQYRYLRIFSADLLPVIPFEDVPRNVFYTDPVLWAVENEITNGMSTNPPLFCPLNTCTRSQVVTFLWRSVGSPQPVSNNNPFVDVPQDAFYYTAVLWAVEQGITNGMDTTHFGPDLQCTRGHVATFLWRSLKQPAISNPVNPFTDLEQGAFYFDAVLWAAETGVTTGITATTFAPASTCTRGQIVTFLWRASGSPAIN